jgi:hypothetical protein
MNTNHSGRLWVVFAVLYLALSCIFPDAPRPLFWVLRAVQDVVQAEPRAGIDMVGGTSLTYDIKQPEGGTTASERSPNRSRRR